MDRDARLKQFACALFSHVYREYNTTFDLPVKLPHVFTHHAAADCSDEEAKAVLKLCLSMRNVFNGLFVRTFETFQRSTQHFMTFLTSKSLKLCQDDVFLSFLMICAFIAELNLFCLINGCFAFMNTAPKCLQAIFNRRLKKEFYANGGWESLRYFSEHFMQTNNGNASEDVASEIVSPSLLASIKESLDESSTDEESDSSSNEEEDIGDIEDDEEEFDEIEIDSPADALGVSSGSASVAAHAATMADSDDDSESSDETEMDSDDSDEDSDEEESENDVAIAQTNGVKKRIDFDDEESVEEGEITAKPNGLKQSVDSDDDSESSEESDPSSMSEEETESEDSEADVAPSSVQTNCIKPIMQKNLHADKKESLI